MMQAKQNDAVNRTGNKESSVGAGALAEDVCYVEVKSRNCSPHSDIQMFAHQRNGTAETTVPFLWF